MPSITAFLSLFAITACVLAAPLPPVARNVPALHEVIRNPTPINAGLIAGVKVPSLVDIDLGIHTGEPSSIEIEVLPPARID
jgi:hypothetical protein